jgi:hypothetical protein
MTSCCNPAGYAHPTVKHHQHTYIMAGTFRRHKDNPITKVSGRRALALSRAKEEAVLAHVVCSPPPIITGYVAARLKSSCRHSNNIYREAK